ncbi:MAG: sulfatase [Planctomycetota bacterium]
MRRRGTLRSAAAALALASGLALSCSGGEAGAERRPDVVLIVIDTLRADRLSCYGYPRPTTPVLDRLAREGARFQDVTAQSSWTLPSMVSMLSGRYLTAYRDFLDAGAPTLAETFAEAGYSTVGVVGNVLLKPEGGFGRGFDHYDARPAPGTPGDDRVRARDIEDLAAAMWEPLDEALATGDDGERPPLFLYLHPFDPHAPYVGDATLDAPLPPAEAVAVEPAGWQAETLARLGPAPPAGDDGWGNELAELRRRRGLHDQDVRHTDDVLGEVLAELEQRGVLENCVLAVVSDHGECLWERLAPMPPDRLRREPPATFFYQDHGAYLYEEGVATPMLFWGTGVEAGLEPAVPVENVDVFPTLLELCQVPARGDLHGRSLAPLLRGDEPGPWRETVHSQVLFSTSIRDLTSGEKLIVPTEHGERLGAPSELFRLGDDPLERTPIDDAAAASRLRARIEAWTERYPTSSTFGMAHDPEREKMLNDLGYTDAHTGG